MNSDFMTKTKDLLKKSKSAVKRGSKAAFSFLRRFFNIYVPKFLKNNFEVSINKGWKTAGIILGTVLMAAVVIFVESYTSAPFAARWWLLAAALCLPILVTVSCVFTVRIKNDKFDKIWHLVLLLLLPFLTITMTECLNDVFIYNMTYLGLLGNYLVILIMLFLVFAISGSIRLSVLIVNPILFGFALAHSYIMNFRGTPFIPMDFLSITTAVGVANTYSYIPTYKEMTGIMLFCLIIVLGLKIKTPKYNLVTKVISRVFTGTFSSVLLILFYFTSVFADMGVKPDFWNQTRGYHNYGFVFNFFCNTKYLYMNEPSGYNPDEVGDFVSSRVEDEKEPENNAQVSENSPNIICIMNESLSDLSVLGEFTTNEDYMPFLRSLTENTIRGNLYVPVIGAGTSNTEFEFLTGHTTAFLPSGSNAYMLYVNNPIASLVSTLEGQGYSSFAFHPYYAAGWKRPTVYKNLGFNRFISLENVMDIKLMQEYQDAGNDSDYLAQLMQYAYPNNPNMLLRQYISDSYNYEWLIKDFEAHDSKQPYFVFNVTMQNHGGYSSSCINFNESIYTTSTTKAYNKVNKYLSLVKASDDAFKQLIEYFSKIKEPTIICMFGDHHPSVETGFIAEVMGVSSLNNLTIEQEQSRHITPFYIWANYDIEEKTVDKLSANYLSSLVLKTAGVELTEYNKYLLNLSQVLPVIDTVGYIDADNNYYRWSDTSPYSGVLDEYEKIQYNNVFDQDNKKTGIFYLEGYEYIEPEIYSEELINKPQTEIKDIVIPEADLAAEENTLAEAG